MARAAKVGRELERYVEAAAEFEVLEGHRGRYLNIYV
jgi:hypothetical protein